MAEFTTSDVIIEQFAECFQLFTRGIMKPIEKQFRGEVPNSGLHVMSNIYFKGPATMSDITGILKCSKQQTTQTVDKLIKSGFALRESDETDRRKVWIMLTNEGKAYVEKMLKTASQQLAQRLEKLDVDESQSLVESLKVLNRLLNKMADSEIEKVDIMKIIKQEDKL
ncbi:MAG: MarR family transcriptional regulator [Clostridia bacterium]|nr:MarR family transcriptional regulator [Clostridia bacterium]